MSKAAGGRLRCPRAPGLASLILGGRRRRFGDSRGAAPSLAEDDRNRRSDENRRIGAADDTDEHRERKPAQRLATEQKEREDRQERRAGRDDRASQRLIDAQIHDLLERLPPQ